MINSDSNLKSSALNVYIESVSTMTLGVWGSQILEKVMMVGGGSRNGNVQAETR